MTLKEWCDDLKVVKASLETTIMELEKIVELDQKNLQIASSEEVKESFRQDIELFKAEIPKHKALLKRINQAQSRYCKQK